MLSLLALVPLLASSAAALSADEMRSKSVYQLVTDRFARPSSATGSCSTSDRKYCGGTWSAIEDKLDYIQGMGFDTIWISPIVENIGGDTGLGQAYHGYWTLDPAKINTNFGSEDDLKSLASALHNKGMYLQVDVVINHVAATSSSNFEPSDSYGAFNSADDFHPFCWVENYDNQTNVEDCWLGDTQVALPDLNTESSTVADYWNSWISGVISNYSVDAIRIDTVKHVPKTFWKSFTSNVDVFNQGEVLDGDPKYVGDYQANGGVNPFNYAVYYPITWTFNTTSYSMDQLISYVSQVKGNTSDPTLLGSFVNNHDNARFESYQTDTAVGGMSCSRETYTDDS